MLRIHGQITAESFQLDVLRECDGLSDYPACIPQLFETLHQQYLGSLFINVRRDRNPQTWLQSAERQFVGLELLNTGLPATSHSRGCCVNFAQ